MNSVLGYGKILAKSVLSEEILSAIPFTNSLSRNFSTSVKNKSVHFITVFSGLSKIVQESRFSSLNPLNRVNKKHKGQLIKKNTFGDDAYFVASHQNADVLGVADGVGGWRQYNIDPSLFPRNLMSICQKLVTIGNFIPDKPISLLDKSYQQLKELRSPSIGSCTACIISLNKKTNTLHAANLGDSGFIVVRNNKIIHRSSEQIHQFNTPFQLSYAPNLPTNLFIADSPLSAETSSIEVEANDIIVMGTDGLFDNLPEKDILKHLQLLKEQNVTMATLQTVADGIARDAHSKGYDSRYISPFAKAASKHGLNVLGGKPDDVTVILAKVEGIKSGGKKGGGRGEEEEEEEDDDDDDNDDDDDENSDSSKDHLFYTGVSDKKKK